MVKLPAFIHINLVSDTDRAGDLVRHIEFTSPGIKDLIKILQFKGLKISREEHKEVKSSLFTFQTKFLPRKDLQAKDPRSSFKSLLPQISKSK